MESFALKAKTRTIRKEIEIIFSTKQGKQKTSVAKN